MHKQNILEKISSKNIQIGIIGLGYVGLPLALRFAEEDVMVMGFDIDQTKIDYIEKGETYIKHITSESIAEQSVKRKMFSATTDFSKAKECDALIICVPTPLTKHKEPNLKYIEKTCESLAPYIRAGQVISLESTTYPGTTEEVVIPLINRSNLKVGEELFVIYSPEREDPGRKDFTTKTIPKVCGGYSSNCLEVGEALYQLAIDEIVKVSSCRAAEMTKLLENIHRSVNIGLVNEMKVVADKLDINIHEVIDAAASKPFGFVAYRPGPGLGGHCIPIDPFYLTWKAKEYGVNTRFIELAGEINDHMIDFVIEKTILGLNNYRKAINGAKVLVLGIAYKKNIDDSRETPAAPIIEKLMNLGAEVSYSDPHVSTFPVKRDYSFDMKSVELTEKTLASFDCCILVTDHDDFDYTLIESASKLVIDTRGKFKKHSEKVIKA
jgi:UDP-N-acetyl-D-glucosamine dehydrogenase